MSTQKLITTQECIEFLDEEIENVNSWIENDEPWEGEEDMKHPIRFRDMLTEIRRIVESRPSVTRGDVNKLYDDWDRQMDEEHGEMTIPEGKYKIRMSRELDLVGAVKKVLD